METQLLYHMATVFKLTMLTVVNFQLAKGDKVEAGDLIAKVGSTGDSTGPHCHFEIRINGKPVDPGQYIYN